MFHRALLGGGWFLREPGVPAPVSRRGVCCLQTAPSDLGTFPFLTASREGMSRTAVGTVNKEGRAVPGAAFGTWQAPFDRRHTEPDSVFPKSLGCLGPSWLSQRTFHSAPLSSPATPGTWPFVRTWPPPSLLQPRPTSLPRALPQTLFSCKTEIPAASSPRGPATPLAFTATESLPRILRLLSASLVSVTFPFLRLGSSTER